VRSPHRRPASVQAIGAIDSKGWLDRQDIRGKIVMTENLAISARTCRADTVFKRVSPFQIGKKRREAPHGGSDWLRPPQHA